MSSNHHASQRLSLAGLVVALGIIYGDIGTSPLYVFKAIINGKEISEQLILGGLSCIFWTITLQTTVKYVGIVLNADNNGEGGIFALFALVRRRKPYLIVPAIIGGCALLADGMITPPISVSSAVEGLTIRYPDLPTIPIVIAIITGIFLLQRMGTSIVGKLFGPVMMVWFGMLGILGFSAIGENLSIFKALNPVYAIELLTEYPNGFWLLGAVFLCTTGAEALYSDMGHCGKHNIRVSWIFVKSALLLNYFGQGAWLLNHIGKELPETNPFYTIMPDWFLLPGVIIATMATIIASQAMISGSYTLVSEAIRLNVWPKVKIKFPSDLKGQIYVPSVNWILWLGCIGIVLHFEESSAMEAAYGLAIIITMLMTTILLVNYLQKMKTPKVFLALLILVYIPFESSFLVANIVKIPAGGWMTLLVSMSFMFVMWIWYKGRKIKNRLTEFVNLRDYLPLLHQLSVDDSLSKYSTHLVYLTSADHLYEIESKVMYSILQKRPKRADVYWFVHIHVDDQPYTMEYKVDHVTVNDVVRVEFRLGFRVEQKINFYFRKVVEELVKNGEVDVTSRYTSLRDQKITGDFRFVVLKRHLSNDNVLQGLERFIMQSYFTIDRFSLSEENAFGLDTSSVTVEKVPLVISPMKEFKLKRVYDHAYQFDVKSAPEEVSLCD
ncbi:MAG: KUP/HAK/KT family potassium transporter [Bacteroidia bacterium]|nr:KUP/HAK/KT family potassium transporter [Bacteroidia bacterium]MCF8427334.1 KUP/HAK/KT family potassium transporter [Bacteroidia bacterium]